MKIKNFFNTNTTGHVKQKFSLEYSVYSLLLMLHDYL